MKWYLNVVLIHIFQTSSSVWTHSHLLIGYHYNFFEELPSKTHQFLNRIVSVLFYILHTHPRTKTIRFSFENKNSPLKVKQEIYKLLQFLTTSTETYHKHRKLANLITWTAVLSNTMTLSHHMWIQPRRMGHAGEVCQNVVTGEVNGKPLQYSCLENPMNSMKRQKDRILKMNSQVRRCPIYYWRSAEK